MGLCCLGAAAVPIWLVYDDHKSHPDSVGRDVERISGEKFHAVAKNVYLSLPDGAKWLDGYYYHWQEWSVCARFAIPGPSLDAFIRNSHLPSPVPDLRPSEIVHPNHPASKHDPGWDGHRPVHVSGITEPYKDVWRNLMFDLDRADIITVYLVYSRNYPLAGATPSTFT